MIKTVHVNFVKLYCTAEIQQDLYAQKMGAGPCRSTTGIYNRTNRTFEMGLDAWMRLESAMRAL